MRNMSEVFRSINRNDIMPSHIETHGRMVGRTFGKTTFRSGLLSQDRNRMNLQLKGSSDLESLADRRLGTSGVHTSSLAFQSRLTQDCKTNSFVNNSAVSHTFGLQSRTLATGPSSHSEFNFNQNTHDAHHKNTMSAASRTFGFLSEGVRGVNTFNNEPSNADLLRSESDNSSLVPRTFGLQRNLTLRSRFLSENDLRVNQDLDALRSNVNASVVSRTFGLSSENQNLGLNSHYKEGYIHDFKSDIVNSSLMTRPFAQQSKSLTVHSGLLPEGNLRLNHDSTHNNSSTVFKSFGPSIRSNALVTGSQMHGSLRCNDGLIGNDGFRRPTLSRVIRGRTSTLSSRLFHSQNVERQCKDLSNNNGFNVSHIPRREMDTLSESRLALNMRSNWMDNQSVAGSVLSVASMKAQFMNLLENLHHSILNIEPHMTAEAVRAEFDKAKQGLENISEICFVPSIREPDAASIISQASKCIDPPKLEPALETVLDGGSLHLKSSNEILKTLISSKEKYRNRFLSNHAEEAERRKAHLAISAQGKDSDDDELAGIFKKPKAYVRRRKGSRSVKAKTPNGGKGHKAEVSSKAVSLKQWYPIAVGTDLILCGIDEGGAAVKTEAVKKRLNRRRVELMSGAFCNLIGSPSPLVSVLPKKIVGSLSNGLTDRWRVLQKELLNCQTAEAENKKRKSQSPRASSSPRKKGAKTLEENPKKGKAKSAICSPKKLTAKISEEKTKKGKLKSQKVRASPKKKEKVAEVLTRSGRAVKPPTMFWLVPGSDEVSSSLAATTPEHRSIEGSLRKKGKKGKKDTKEAKKHTKEAKKHGTNSPKKQSQKADDDSLSFSVKAKATSNVSPAQSRLEDEETPRKKTKGRPPEGKSPKGTQRKDSEQEARVHSSTEDAKRQNKTRKTQGKRKREVYGDIDVVLTKKSKIEKKTEAEVESTVEDVEPVTKKGKGKKPGLALSTLVKKPPTAKNLKKVSKKKTTRENEMGNENEGKEVNEFEEDFELELDDIEIPEIANISENPQLSRSQLRLVSMETPPLKYFNSNLRLLRSATPMRSPDWCISQRTESEVKQFQRRREEALKKKIKVNVKKSVVTEKTKKSVQSKDLKRVMEWVAEKTVRSPTWSSRVVQYVIPSRKRMEQQEDDEELDEAFQTSFF